MQTKAPQQQPSKTPKIHIISEYGRTKCNVLITPKWETTLDEANCQICLGQIRGWKKLKKKWGQP